MLGGSTQKTGGGSTTHLRGAGEVPWLGAHQQCQSHDVHGLTHQYRQTQAYLHVEGYHGIGDVTGELAANTGKVSGTSLS